MKRDQQQNDTSNTRRERPAPQPLKVRTAVRAGDIYMQYPRGSNG